MAGQNSLISSDPTSFPVTPLPYALYISDGLIFELYNGGRPRQAVLIQWERLEPISESAVEADSGGRP